MRALEECQFDTGAKCKKRLTIIEISSSWVNLKPRQLYGIFEHDGVVSGTCLDQGEDASIKDARIRKNLPREIH